MAQKEKEKQKVMNFAQKAKVATLQRAITRGSNPPDFLNDPTQVALQTLTYVREFDANDIFRSGQNHTPSSKQILHDIQIRTGWAETLIVKMTYGVHVMSADIFHVIFYAEVSTTATLQKVPIIEPLKGLRYVGSRAEPGVYDVTPTRSTRIIIHKLPLNSPRLGPRERVGRAWIPT